MSLHAKSTFHKDGSKELRGFGHSGGAPGQLNIAITKDGFGENLSAESHEREKGTHDLHLAVTSLGRFAIISAVCDLAARMNDEGRGRSIAGNPQSDW
jgi:hypothetical protein